MELLNQRILQPFYSIECIFSMSLPRMCTRAYGACLPSPCPDGYRWRICLHVTNTVMSNMFSVRVFLKYFPLSFYQKLQKIYHTLWPTFEGLYFNWKTFMLDILKRIYVCVYQGKVHVVAGLQMWDERLRNVKFIENTVVWSRK